MAENMTGVEFYSRVKGSAGLDCGNGIRVRAVELHLGRNLDGSLRRRLKAASAQIGECRGNSSNRYVKVPMTAATVGLIEDVCQRHKPETLIARYVECAEVENQDSKLPAWVVVTSPRRDWKTHPKCRSYVFEFMRSTGENYGRLLARQARSRAESAMSSA